MKSVKTKSDETASEFIARWGISKDELLAANPAVRDTLEKALGAKLRIQQKLGPYAIEELNVPDSATESGQPGQGAPQQSGGPPVLERPEPNPDHDWLTFESRWNDKNFRKKKEAVGYGLFILPLDEDVEIIASEQLPDVLVEAFFPHCTKQEVMDFSASSCRWRKGSADAKPPKPASPGAVASSRGQSRLILAPPMVMPYNILANDDSSAAIGTDLSCIKPGPGKPDMVGDRLLNTWTMWETASRSSVVQIQSMKTFSEWKVRSRDKTWTFRQPPDPPANKDKPFKLSDRLPNCFSIKTGVRWIGSKPQGSGDAGGGKDYLEVNALLASMRSDWVEFVEGKIGKDPKLIILRELLTVTYPTEPPILGKPVRDGYQVRDLSALNPANIYFPPLSIPFGGEVFVNDYNQKNPGDRKNFTDFWRTAYAEAVGVAKAKLMLRYGLQLTTPNPQNFLLEFDKATLKPTGTVVIRDIGDAKLHSEVIQQIGGDHPAIQYELKNPDRPKYLPAQTSNEGRVGDTQDHSRFSQYPLNTRSHWHQYSSFKAMYGVENLPEREITTIDWGRAHNAKYVETLASMLGRRELQQPIYDEAVLQAILADPADQVPEKFKSIMRDAKEIIPRMKADLGSVAKINADAWRSCRQQYSLRSMYQCEWALEVFADELLHARLKTSEVTSAIKSKWGKWA
jgi:hypothetical protein